MISIVIFLLNLLYHIAKSYLNLKLYSKKTMLILIFNLKLLVEFINKLDNDVF